MAQVFATYRVQTLHRPCVLSYGVAAGALVPAHRDAGTDLPGSVPRLMHRGHRHAGVRRPRRILRPVRGAGPEHLLLSDRGPAP